MARSVVLALLLLLPAAARAEPADEPRLRGHTVSEWADLLGKGSHEAASALGRLGPRAAPAVPALLEALKVRDGREYYVPGHGVARTEDLRDLAADALGRIGADAERVAPDLLAGLHQRGRFGDACAGALVRLGPGAVPELASAVDDRRIGFQAAALLGRIGPPAKAAVPCLIERMKGGESVSQRVRAAEALWRIAKHPDALPTLIAALDYQGGVWAADALARLGADARPALDALKKRLTDPKTANAHLAVALWQIERSPEGLAALAQALKSPFKDQVRLAVRTLKEIGGPAKAALPDLSALLEAEVREERGLRSIGYDGVTLIEALDRIGREADVAVPALVTALHSRYEPWRDAVVQALRRPGAAPTADLEALLEQGDWRARVLAAKVLGLRGEAAKGAVPALAAALADKDEDVRRAAEVALSNMGPHAKAAAPALVAYLASPVHTGDDAFSTLVALGPDAVPALVQALGEMPRDGRAVDRRALAVWVLERIGPAAKDAAPALARLLRDGQVLRAEEALAEIGEPALAPVVEVLRGQDREARQRAAWTLFLLAGRGHRADQAVPALKDALADDFRAAQRYAAMALGDYGPAAREAVPALLPLLDHPWRPLREEATFALARIDPKNEKVAHALGVLLRTGQGYERQRAGNALVDLGADARPAIPALRQALDDPFAYVSAARALVNCGDRPDPAELERRLGDKKEHIRRGAVILLRLTGDDAVPALVKALRDSNSHVRNEAFNVLVERIDQPAAAAALLEELLAPRGNHRGVVGAFRKVGRADELVPVVRRALKGEAAVRDGGLQAVRELGPAAKDTAPELRALLQDASPVVRGRAAVALVEVGADARDAVPVLLARLDDRDSRVRAEAARALGRAGGDARTVSPALEALLLLDYQDVAEAAAEGLAALGGDGLPLLTAALRHEDGSVRQAALHGLQKMGPAARPAAAALTAALKDEAVRIAAAEALWAVTRDPAAVAALAAMTRDIYDPVSAAEAAAALGRLGRDAPEALAALREALHHPDADVRKAARAALDAAEGGKR
jgi:HEAT repeat protein